MKRIAGVLLFAVALLLTGCPNPAPATGKDKKDAPGEAASVGWAADPALIKVAVSIPPQKELIEKMAGGRVQVISILTSGDNFDTGTISKEKQALLDSAQIFVTIGAPFEKKLTVPQSVKVVDMRENVRLKPYSTHTRYLNGKSKGGEDPYFWMSPSLLVSSLSNVFLALSDIAPSDKDFFSQEYTRLTRQLNSLEGDLKRTTVNAEGREVYTDYNALGYLCEDLGVKQVLFQPQLGKDLNDLARSAITDRVQVIFFGPYMPQGFDGKLADLIKGKVAAFNPLTDSYFESLQGVADAIREGYAR